MARIHSVSVPETSEGTWQDAKILAQRRGWSMSGLIMRLLERELKLVNLPEAYLVDVAEDEDEEVRCYAKDFPEKVSK